MTQCYACQKTLEPVFEDSDADACSQFDNALIVEIHGGYGMFTDSLGASKYDGIPGLIDYNQVILCHECAHEACEALPWMNRLIDPSTLAFASP